MDADGVLMRPAVRIFNGRKPLHALCCDTTQPLPALLMVMLRGGARVNEMDCRGQQPLHYAIRRGSAQCVRKLLEFGAHLHLRDSALRSPMHIAAQLPHPLVAQLLLQSGAFPDTPDLDGCQPLHYAVAFVRPETVRLLVNYAASPAVKSVQGVTPLGVACQMKSSLLMLSPDDGVATTRYNLPPRRHSQNQGLRNLLENRDTTLYQLNRCVQILVLAMCQQDKLNMSDEFSRHLNSGALSPALCCTRSAPQLTDLCRGVCRQRLRSCLDKSKDCDSLRRPLEAAVAFLPVPTLLRRLILLEDI